MELAQPINQLRKGRLRSFLWTGALPNAGALALSGILQRFRTVLHRAPFSHRALFYIFPRNKSEI